MTTDNPRSPPEPIDLSASPAASELGTSSAGAFGRPDTPGSGGALAILAHEIRGRLNGLTITTESLRSRVKRSAPMISRDWVLARLERQARHLKRLQRVLDMVLFAYRDGGVLAPSLERTDLCEVVKDALLVEHDALKCAHCDCDLQMPEHVVGQWDHNQLELALANLVNNAAKYGAGHPVEIRVFVQGRTACVSVRDHGIGIRSEDIPLLFRPFGRLQASAGSSGVGLGLWFAKSVALAHGGDVHASSRPRGACFTLVLPLGAS